MRTTFPIPTRVVAEANDALRMTGYVAGVESGRVWLYLADAPRLDSGRVLRLIFRCEAGAAIGMTGAVVGYARDRLGVAVRHPIDRAILASWRDGEAADLSRYACLSSSEKPTANRRRIARSDTELLRIRPE